MKSDAINHDLDTFVIWLNPRVTVLSDGLVPASYSVGSRPTSGVTAVVADMITVPAIVMEAVPGSITSTTPYGISSVPVTKLHPQLIPSDVDNPKQSTMPGLAVICKNLKIAEYNASACTQQDQCGCNPSDFAPILAQDPLLNYNSTTHMTNSYAGAISPLEVDVSGASVCAQNPLPSGSDCRYIEVPISPGSTTPQFQALDGASVNTFQQADATTDVQTTGQASAYDVGISFQVGNLLSSLRSTNTWTWLDSKSSGSLSGSANTMSVIFKTSTASCGENVNIYEDTIYHTFAFQTPTGNTGCF